MANTKYGKYIIEDFSGRPESDCPEAREGKEGKALLSPRESWKEGPRQGEAQADGLAIAIHLPP